MLIFSLLAAAPVALGCAIVTRSVDAAESPLKVSLEMTGNTKVKAVLTNSGESTLKLFNSGTVLDPAPVDKVKVFSGGMTTYISACYPVRRRQRQSLYQKCS